jgi:ferric-dicitrate binding protein FerR (iron transport regulator)
MNIELLKKYINNHCTPEEVDVVIEWFKENASDSDRRAVLKELWENIEEEEVNDVDFNHLLDKIHHRINVERSIKVNQTHHTEKNVIRPFFSFMVKVAASLFIPLLAISLYFFSRDASFAEKQIYSEITSPNGSRTFFELPDGSKVWLNNGSSLKFPTKFTGNSRLLELKGEGYFEIVHNDKMPLIVRSGEVQVMVHGTEFNVLAYPDDRDVSVTLVKGSVSLQKICESNKVKNILTLKPSQQAIYDKTDNEVDYMKIDPKKFTSWKDGKLIFIDDSIDVIMEKLERWYNVEISLKDKELSKITYTATFTDETLQQVLYLLKMATPIEYKIHSSHKLNDGSYSKRKVDIYYKS